jgi:hypothetical protein
MSELKRPRALIAVALLVALVAIVVGGIALAGGGGDEETTTSPAPSEAPSAGAAPSPGALPPEFVECMADRGFDIESSADIHSAPPQVLQECFGHSGGVGP